MFSLLKANIYFGFKLLPLIFGLLNVIRLSMEFYYAKRMQSYFNIPYEYFVIDWKKNLIETIYYTFMLEVYFIFNNIMILYQNEFYNNPVFAIMLIFANSIYIIYALTCNFDITNEKSFGNGIDITIFISFWYTFFLVTYIFKPIIPLFFIPNSLFSIVFLVIGIFNYFKYHLNASMKFPTIMIGKENYVIVSARDNLYVIKKIYKDFTFKHNGSYRIVSDIKNKEIVYHTVKKQSK